MNVIGGSTSTRMFLTAAAVLVALVAAPRAEAAPPANDAFAAAQALAAGAPASAGGTNAEATKEAGEPAHAANAGGRSVWFSWTATSSRRVRVSTCGSNFNTLLGVYTGTSVGGLTRVAENDDSSACSNGNRSSAELNAAAGRTYRIAVDGKNGASGSVALAVADVGPATPANDDFDAAVDVASASGLPAAAVGANAGATAQSGEPAHDGRAATRSVWYRWTAAESEPVQIATCGSAVDARVGLYLGTSLTALTRVTMQRGSCGTGTGRLYTFDAVAGRQYAIAVDSATAGSLLLSISRVPPQVSVADTSVAEGDSQRSLATFAVTLARPSPEAVTVAYGTTNELISPDGWRHFEPAAGLVRFAPGETRQSFSVAVNGDIEDEGDQEIRVELASPVGASLGASEAVGTILDDDGPAPYGWDCGPLMCLVPGEGPVRMSRSDHPSELVRSIAIKRKPRSRAVMEIGPKRLGDINRGDEIEASAEVEVSVTCLEKMAQCVGTRYGYSPRVRGRLVLRSEHGDRFQTPVSPGRSLTCSQNLPNRNHHCVLVFPPSSAKVTRDCGACHLTLMLSAAHTHAKPGNRLVIGADADHGIEQDRGHVNALVTAPGAEEPRVAGNGSPARQAIPVGRRTSGGQKLVVYSQRLNDLEAYEQVFVDARAVVSTSRLPYGTFLGAELVLSDSPDAVAPSSAATESGVVTEKNGFNCTRGSSAHDNPCLIRKVGFFRVKRSTSEPLYVNLVIQAAARFGGRWRSDDRAQVLGRGGVQTRRWSPLGWARVAVPPKP